MNQGSRRGVRPRHAGKPAHDPGFARAAEAAAEVVACIRQLEEGGTNLVADVLGGRPFVEYEHYPPEDVRDRRTCAQYYFHAHPQTRGKWNDYGHFHTFLTLPGTLPCHLIAIAMNRDGRPVRLFTTNRWVTGGPWLVAGDMIGLLDRFAIHRVKPSRPLNRWITAMFILFRAEMEQLLRMRDRRIAVWQRRHPGRDVFQDRNLEVASGQAIDLERRLADIRTRLGFAD